MSLPVVSSMIEAIVKLSNCGRRKQVAAHTYERDVLLKYAVRSRLNEPDDVHKASDIGEASTTDFSDGSEQFAASTDCSDTEASMIKTVSAAVLRGNQKMRPDRRSPMKPPQVHQSQTGLKTQPEDPPVAAAALPGTRLNSNAALFVPCHGAAAPATNNSQCNSQQVRQHIRLLKDALEEFDVSNVNDPAPNPSSVSTEGQNLLALQEALNKLSPQEAVVVRNLLASKEVEQNVCSSQVEASVMQAIPSYHGSAGMMQHARDPCPMMESWVDDVVVPPGAVLPGFHCQPPSSVPGAWPFMGGVWHQGVEMQSPFSPYQGAPRKSSRSTAKVNAPRRNLESTEAGESLATHLRDLAQLDSGRVLMVRKINHLGDGAAEALKSYFSKFGVVERVLTSATRSASKPVRVRPATLGFMVLDSAETVQAVLSHGADHVVQGVTITISTFQSHPIDEPDAEKKQ